MDQAGLPDSWPQLLLLSILPLSTHYNCHLNLFLFVSSPSQIFCHRDKKLTSKALCPGSALTTLCGVNPCVGQAADVLPACRDLGRSEPLPRTSPISCPKVPSPSHTKRDSGTAPSVMWAGNSTQPAPTLKNQSLHVGCTEVTVWGLPAVQWTTEPPGECLRAL